MCRDRVGQAKSFLSRQNVFMLRQSWSGQEFYVAIECFYVATEWPSGEVLCCDRAILCRDIVGQVGTIFCLDSVFFCHDKVGLGKEKLCRDKAILCRDRVG